MSIVEGLKERGEQYKKSMVGYMILKPVHRWYWGLLQENTGKVQVSIGKSLTERMSREAPSLPPRAASVQILWFIKARQGKGGHYQKAAQLGSSSSLSTSSIFTIHGLMLQKGLTIIFLDNVIHSGVLPWTKRMFKFLSCDNFSQLQFLVNDRCNPCL